MEASFYTLSPPPASARRPLVVSFDPNPSPDKSLLLPLVPLVVSAVKYHSVVSAVKDGALLVKETYSKRALPLAQQTAEALREFATKRPARVDATAGAESPPWTITNERFSILEPELRERVLKITADENVFSDASEGHVASLHQPLEHSETVPMARAALREDSKLVDMRYRLVPAVMTETVFWQRYFLAVLRIRRELLVDHTALGRGAEQDAARPASVIPADGDGEMEGDREPMDTSPLPRPTTASSRPDAALTAVDAEWEAMLREELECFSPHLPASLHDMAELESLLKSPAAALFEAAQSPAAALFEAAPSASAE
ncbi:hypothetical protein T492DRAFT_1029566 [Pavlovales sp. CCMP2436]|nr:hypothetical protein T492DRAFT_1029566 [Pavlovales sp. CCMP2436]|mmetsp:Transcript_44024/g.109041  ORF Transcript_44024/g.109041 Transcript_44024/m.109041 type:complete len:317 (+) Transcript_44024:92-1042(+)